MASDRDILADKLAECSYEGMSARETADALLVAGVRPPARVITDPTEADALPELSIVLTSNKVGWQMTDRDYDGSAIWEAGTSGATSEQLLAGGSVTVLWAPEPTEEGQANA